MSCANSLRSSCEPRIGFSVKAFICNCNVCGLSSEERGVTIFLFDELLPLGMAIPGTLQLPATCLYNEYFNYCFLNKKSIFTDDFLHHHCRRHRHRRHCRHLLIFLGSCLSSNQTLFLLLLRRNLAPLLLEQAFLGRLLYETIFLHHANYCRIVVFQEIKWRLCFLVIIKTTTHTNCSYLLQNCVECLSNQRVEETGILYRLSKN